MWRIPINNMKVYEILFEDEYDNLYQLGYYKSLASAVDDINSELSVYNIKLKYDDLKEYAGTFGACFDANIGYLTDAPEDSDAYSINIRGFILDSDAVIEDITNAK